MQKNTKRTSLFYKNKNKHYGARSKATKKFNYFWALDVPDNYPKAISNSVFKDKCLLSSCILGILQNAFYKSNRQDKRYQRAQYINSTLINHKNIAGKTIFDEIIKLLDTTKLAPDGPYELEKTCQIISKEYNCQIFVFDGISNSERIFIDKVLHKAFVEDR